MATEDGWRSIAFTALGTGHLGYQPDHVVQILFQTVRHFFERQPSSIESVHVVIRAKASIQVKKVTVIIFCFINTFSLVKVKILVTLDTYSV